MNVAIRKSSKPDKKFDAVIDGKKTISFGAKGFSDFTLTKDLKQKERYISRHSGMGETWSRDGIETPGFYARWVLWNKPTLQVL